MSIFFRQLNKYKPILIILISAMMLVSCQSKQMKNLEKPIKISTDSIAEKDFTNHPLLTKRNLNQQEIDGLTKNINQLVKQKRLAKYIYPSMSACGGGLYGYYQDSTLLMIDATYHAELGFSSRKIYWHDEQIVKILYREYFAEWEKYDQKYPKEKFEWDPEKMTYSDTTYHITLGNTYLFQKIAAGKVISEKRDTLLMNHLIKCGFDMKTELAMEKKLEKY